jgi:hypothetical protein
MQRFEALDAALSMVKNPHLVRQARRGPLPAGMLFLLEVAAGDSTAVQAAVGHTERSESTLREAASFYIEQIMLDDRADKYRVLGASRGLPPADLRRHMALLMRWLHPDVATRGEGGPAIDRSVYADIVTEAWETLKNDERRAAYDARRTIGGRPGVVDSWRGLLPAGGAAGDAAVRPVPAAGRPCGSGRLVVRRLRRPPFWVRLIALFRRRR